MTASRKRRRAIDWERIEAEYRAGQLSIQEIARQHQVTDRAIRLRAASDGWERALAERMRQKVRECLVREDAGVPATPHPTPQSTPRGLARDLVDGGIVEAAAERGAAVVRLERADIAAALRTRSRPPSEGVRNAV
jgi:anti-sigma-K factor RskA